MKLLLLTQVLPYPPDSGPKVKTWNLLKYLVQQHEVTLVSFVRGDQSAQVTRLRALCRAVYTIPMQRSMWRDIVALARSALNGQPWVIVRDDRRAMHRLLDELAAREHFDAAHADQLNMAQYAARIPGARKVLDAHNALWLLYKRLWENTPPGPRKWLLERDWRLLSSYEGRICREFDAVLAVSAEDERALCEAAGGAGNISIIPIAVDIDEVVPVKRRPDADHILHIGTMYWPPNIDGITWFIQNIYPMIRAQRPGVVFDVLGARPPQSLLSLAGPQSGINVTGYVADPAPYLTSAGVMVVPLRAAGGMRVKILNAMAQGLPIVSTSIGCEGIAVEPGKHLLVADTPEEFARATLQLMSDRRLADWLGHNGRELVADRYDYRVACRPLDRVYANGHEHMEGNLERAA